MIKHIPILLVLILTGCGGSVNKVCDKNGVCLESWNLLTATSSITVSQLRTAGGTPVVGTTITSTSGGIISDIDPLAQGVNTTAAEAKTVGMAGGF